MLGNATAAAVAASDDEAHGDRRTRRREATKAEILDAAWDLARSEGLTNFSMRDVATQVGMRAPSLYQYFDSKHAIYDAMFGQGAQKAFEAVCADLPDSIDPSDAPAVLLEIATRVFDFSTGDQARMQLLFQRTIPGFEPSPGSYAPAVAMTSTIRTLMIDLGFTDPDAMDLFTAMVGGLVNQQMSNDPGGARWARLLDRTVTMFISEMASPARRGTTGGHSPTHATRRTSTGGKTSTGRTSSTRSATRSNTAAATTNEKRGR